jgi:multisubunit Na+/H+ antiporter MnhG subunit
VVALVTSLLTIIFAAVGLFRAKNANCPTLLAKISLILGIVALVFSVILLLIYVAIIGALSFWD